MSNELVKVDFDYSGLDEDTAGKLEYFVKQGRKLVNTTEIRFVAEFGRILSEARDVLASQDKYKGKFVKWACAEFDITKKTVYRYMNAWDRVLSSGGDFSSWSSSALYLASADEVPVAVQKKLAKLSSKGAVRASDVQKLIDAHRVPAEESETVPFDEAPQTKTPAQLKEEARKLKEQEREREKRKKESQREADRKQREHDRAEAKAKRDREREAEKEQRKKDREAAKAEAKADKFAALPKDEQIRCAQDVLRQLLIKAINAVDDLNRLNKSPNMTPRDVQDVQRVLNAVANGPRQIAAVRILQHVAEKVAW